MRESSISRVFDNTQDASTTVPAGCSYSMPVSESM
jgi:hypothetical protein